MPSNTPNSDGVSKFFTPEETAALLQRIDRRFSSAAVWCETPDGRLLIVKSPYKRHWALPGGIVDPEETPKLAAVRETREEVGIVLEPSDLKFQMVVNRVYDALGYSYQFIFQASVTARQIDAIVLERDEIDEYALVSREEVVASPKYGGYWIGSAITDWAHGRTGYAEYDFRGK
ncbi:MAG TPA: NUDIX hydrolase [Candidatus Saccharimonadaceae bacterium]|nr:NUDIX hydrolase [Candidatus Saccharimonadaceae bacterium]